MPTTKASPRPITLPVSATRTFGSRPMRPIGTMSATPPVHTRLQLQGKLGSHMLTGKRCPDSSKVVMTVAHRMILKHELTGERSIAIERHGRGAIQLLIAKSKAATDSSKLMRLQIQR